MKILVTGDLHYNKEHYKWIKKKEQGYDCLCLTGDFLDSKLKNFEEQTKWVYSWIKSLTKPVFLCSGNHDLDDFGGCDWLNNLKNETICTDNYIRKFCGITFGCIPYLGGNLSDFSRCDILVTHVPPSKVNPAIDKSSNEDWGDFEIFNTIEEGELRPAYIFCGHVEQPTQRSDTLFGVKVINPGSNHHQREPNHKTIKVSACDLSHKKGDI